jgi:hypothetical protein
MDDRTVRIPPEICQVSRPASQLFFAVMTRAHVDGTGPLELPKRSWRYARELVALEIAAEPSPGRFELLRAAVTPNPSL